METPEAVSPALLRSSKDVEYMKEVVLLSSSEGQRLLQAATAAGLSQFNYLQPNWENQIYGTHCGIASCVIVFNASAQNHSQERRLTQDEADDFVMSYMS
eukprot:TRINITY_DN16119_c0_g1_i1.p2 TRINITY_DN16119_c0_g1~~TRINITY_DN16119_c0_g1_i1.p2  ORF type:complete len:100 (-),score=18.28 TRINITY_DN16119_c0_g1_i1:354-653(-)